MMYCRPMRSDKRFGCGRQHARLRAHLVSQTPILSHLDLLTVNIAVYVIKKFSVQYNTPRWRAGIQLVFVNTLCSMTRPRRLQARELRFGLRFPSDRGTKVALKKPRVHGLPYGKKRMILRLLVLTHYQSDRL